MRIRYRSGAVHRAERAPQGRGYSIYERGSRNFLRKTRRGHKLGAQ